MSKKSTKRSPIQVDVAAKAEAKLHIKGEVPSSSLGKLVDSLTDIIRPFSEARGLKADVLRMQREDIAIEIAKRARARIAIEKSEVGPVSNKILVPLLEKGSCESAEDDVMIECWANLLAAASVEQSVQPRFVGILGELNGSQAECMERICFAHAMDVIFPFRDLADACLVFAEHHIVEEFNEFVRKHLKSSLNADAVFAELVRTFSRPGTSIAFALISEPGSGLWLDYDSVQKTGIHDDLNFSILESLGLIRYVALQSDVKWGRRKAHVNIYYYHLTELGFEFIQVCARERVQQLEAKDNESRSEDATEQKPFSFH
ncbi:MAG: hypothetical protein JSR89_15460 [Proteobacteria bacterium]|nr:hypothetical protein [Pseudomonadota bacterium]